MQALEGYLIVKCIRVGGKLKLKILTANVPVDPRLYCSGNKEIREEGAIYKVKGSVKLINSATPYYKLSNKLSDYEPAEPEKQEITTLELQELGIEIYAEPICCICLENETNVFFASCRHQMLCVQCFRTMQQTWHICPICKQNISDYKIVVDEISQ